MRQNNFTKNTFQNTKNTTDAAVKMKGQTIKTSKICGKCSSSDVVLGFNVI